MARPSQSVSQTRTSAEDPRGAEHGCTPIPVNPPVIAATFPCRRLAMMIDAENGCGLEDGLGVDGLWCQQLCHLRTGMVGFWLSRTVTLSAVDAPSVVVLLQSVLHRHRRLKSFFNMSLPCLSKLLT